MTRKATGYFSFFASIIVFVGALLLAPQVGSAQESPECEGEQQTIITATGIKITTCNWDLDDAPVDKGAAGLVTTLAPIPETICPCKYNKIKPNRWKKFTIGQFCGVSRSGPFNAYVMEATNSRNKMMKFEDDVGVEDSCRIVIRGREAKVSPLEDDQHLACRNDMFDYEADNNNLPDISCGGIGL